MNHLLLAPLLTGTFLIASPAAQAQTSFSAGPIASFNNTGASFVTSHDVTGSYRTGFEVGVQGNFQSGHLAVQHSLRFSQKGFHHHEYNYGQNYDTDFRLNYLTLPISAAYCFRPDGRGFQVLAGVYGGLLLGGNYQAVYSGSGNGTFNATEQGQVGVGSRQPVPSIGLTGEDLYLRRFDAGVQAGLGYRFGQLLAQATFSYGLLDIMPTGSYLLPSTYNRAAQCSIGYLFTPTH